MIDETISDLALEAVRLFVDAVLGMCPRRRFSAYKGIEPPCGV
jgi:hypothetical protein